MTLEKMIGMSSNPLANRLLQKTLFKNLTLNANQVKYFEHEGKPVLACQWVPRRSALNPVQSVHGGQFFKFLDELGGFTGFTFLNRLVKEGKLPSGDGYPFVVTTNFTGKFLKSAHAGDHLIGIAHLTNVLKDKLEVLAVLLRKNMTHAPTEKIAEVKFSFTPVKVGENRRFTRIFLPVDEKVPCKE